MMQLLVHTKWLLKPALVNLLIFLVRFCFCIESSHCSIIPDRNIGDSLNNIKVASTFLCCWSSVSQLFVRCLDEGIHAPDPPALTLKAAIQSLHLTLQLMILHHSTKSGSKWFGGSFDIA